MLYAVAQGIALIPALEVEYVCLAPPLVAAFEAYRPIFTSLQESLLTFFKGRSRRGLLQ